MARKCNVEKVDKSSLRQFLDNNHIQGFCGASDAYILKYNNEIVAAMTFGKPRYNKDSQYELIRLAFKTDIQIPGGSDKLWKFALNDLGKYSNTSVVSYCDTRLFSGNVYRRLGFTLLNSNSSPTYWYIDSAGDRFHRSKFMKFKLVEIGKKKGEDWSNYSESHITSNFMNLKKVYDKGQHTWIYNLTTTK